MFNSLKLWFDDRTGAAPVLRAVFLEPLPGGARWRTVFGPALAGTFIIQAVTGLLLMTSYVPTATQAWGSVWYIQNQMFLGWLIRGLHHWGSSAMMILLGLHLAQVVFTAAYRAPREVNWWLGIGLMLCVLGLALTGYLLPWDQKGYWAAKVATNIAGGTPIVGPDLQTVIVGGTEYGNQTLTRLYGIHVGLLPPTLIVLLVLHLILRYRHGPVGEPREGRFELAWPGQWFRNLLAWSLVLVALFAWTWREHGVGLEAPADPSTTDYPARPEWYFLPLYQMLNEVPPQYEMLATMVIPGAIVGFLALLPLLDKVIHRGLLRILASGLVLAVAGGAGYLMYKSIAADMRNEEFQIDRAHADVARERASLLASQLGVPPDGAAYLLRRDPRTQGAALLGQQCLSCHTHDARGVVNVARFDLSPTDLDGGTPVETLGDGVPDKVGRALSLKTPDLVASARSVEGASSNGDVVLEANTEQGEKVTLRVRPDGTRIVQETHSQQTGADLAGFGTRGWLRGLLAEPGSPRFFGKTPQLSGMKRWKKDSKLTDAELDDIADFFEKHLMNIPADLTAAEWVELEDVQAHPGYKHLAEGGECAKCHADWVYPNPEAPNLFGWGSPWWIKRMIERPSSAHMYGYLDPGEQMPSFRGRMTDEDLNTLTRYLKNDYPGAEAETPRE